MSWGVQCDPLCAGGVHVLGLTDDREERILLDELSQAAAQERVVFDEQESGVFHPKRPLETRGVCRTCEWACGHPHLRGTWPLRETVSKLDACEVAGLVMD